jgi:hypothetical protein
MNNIFFVDKSEIISELYKYIDSSDKYICITRPRRFGKTTIAHMISAFFTKEINSHDIFKDLNIAKNEQYDNYISKYNTVTIDLSKYIAESDNLISYIDNIKNNLISDFKQLFPNIDLDTSLSITKLFTTVHNITKISFIFILDEWDAIFNADFMRNIENKKKYLQLLKELLKDKSYVSLAYMTGIMPITKFSDGSDLNMFTELNLATDSLFCNYFGFRSEEVDDLYNRYSKSQNPIISREDLKFWYDGYNVFSGETLYNPLSINKALKLNRLAVYWSQSGSYDTLFGHIKNEIIVENQPRAIDALKHLIANDYPVTLNLEAHIPSASKLSTCEEILTSLVLYGLLTYSNENKIVSIPNKELKIAFINEIRNSNKFENLNILIKNSENLLNATIDGDTDRMQHLLSDTFVSAIMPRSTILTETALTHFIINSYFFAITNYDPKYDTPAGHGYADIVLLPREAAGHIIIIELKINKNPIIGINQIKRKKYYKQYVDSYISKTSYKGPIILAAIGFFYKKGLKTPNTSKSPGQNHLPHSQPKPDSSFEFRCLVEKFDRIAKIPKK